MVSQLLSEQGPSKQQSQARPPTFLGGAAQVSVKFGDSKWGPLPEILKMLSHKLGEHRVQLEISETRAIG